MAAALAGPVLAPVGLLLVSVILDGPKEEAACAQP
jgi:hypothetical protein